MLLKGSSIKQLRAFASRALEQGQAGIKSGGVKVIVDVDPLFIM
jgi:hypothetical protein